MLKALALMVRVPFVLPVSGLPPPDPVAVTVKAVAVWAAAFVVVVKGSVNVKLAVPLPALCDVGLNTALTPLGNVPMLGVIVPPLDEPVPFTVTVYVIPLSAVP